MVTTGKPCIHGMVESNCSDCIERKAKRASALKVPTTVPPAIITDDAHGDKLPIEAIKSKEEEGKESQVAPEKTFSEEKIRILNARGNSVEEIAIELKEAGGRVESLITSILIELKVGTIQEAKDIFRALVSVTEGKEKRPPPLLTDKEEDHKRRLGATPPEVIIEVPVDRVRPFPDQPRKYFDPVKLQGLANSIRSHGQRREGEVKWLPEDHRYYCELIDGERRLKAVSMAGRSIFRTLIVGITDNKEQFALSVIVNFGREGHTELEIANAIKRLVEDGWKPIQVADVFGQSLSWVHQHAKIARLAPEIQVWMDPSSPEKTRLKLSIGLMLIDLPLKLQTTLAYEVTSKGLSVNEARPYIRRRAQQEGYIAGDPERTPRKDYANLQSSLKVLVERMGLLLELDLQKVLNNRDPKEILKKVESLNRQVEEFASKLLEIQ